VGQAAQRHLLFESGELERAPGDDPPVDARDEIAVLGVENRAEKRQPRPQLYHMPAHRLDHPRIHPRAGHQGRPGAGLQHHRVCPQSVAVEIDADRPVIFDQDASNVTRPKVHAAARRRDRQRPNQQSVVYLVIVGKVGGRQRSGRKLGLEPPGFLTREKVGPQSEGLLPGDPGLESVS